jgi:predicted TPR repeat methyltransferase
VLQRQPHHFDALHLLGVAARQRGDPHGAIEFISQAIAVDPAQAAAYCNLGAALQDIGDSAAALIEFERALALRPGYALAHNNRGNALRNLARYAEALQSYQDALRHQADYAEAAYNCGTVLHRLDRHDDAVESYDWALRVKPGYADAWCNRGSALHMLQRYDAAMDSFAEALRLDPNHASALCNRGLALHKLGRDAEAMQDYRAAIALRPAYADAHFFLGNVLRQLQRLEEAGASYRRALDCGADAEAVNFALAALGEVVDDAVDDAAGGLPPSAPAAYVKNLFDAYADHFDVHLVDVLQYQTPQCMLEAVRKAGIDAGACVDLGCGTGLCGVLLRPLAKTLAGVDLSPKMLARARQRGIYDSLECAELCVFLAQREQAFDLAVAADVLVYIGDLAPLMLAAKRALRPGGAFVFSVEECTDVPYTLRASQRYAHSSAYVQDVAAQAGMGVRSIERHVLREERGVAIVGLIVVLGVQ